MAERMTNDAKAELLERVAKLIEDNLGYNVERCLGQGDGTGFIYKLNLVGDKLNQVKLTNACIKLDDIYDGYSIWSSKPTGDVRIIITDDGYERDRFKKWSKLSSLNFDKGMSHKPTAKFLDKVKELVEYQVALQKHKDDLKTKRQNDFETLTEWTKRPEMPKGYTLATHGGKRFLIMDGNEECVSDFWIEMKVLSKERMKQFGYNQPVCGMICGYNVRAATLDEALRMFKDLYDLLKNQ